MMKIKMEPKVYYKSRPFQLFLWMNIALLFFLPLFEYPNLEMVNATYVLVGLFSIYLNCCITINHYSFKDEHVVEKFPCRFILHTRKILYSDLYAVEIRILGTGYQHPYIILHFDKKSITNTLNLSKRRFVFGDIDEIEPLIDFVLRKKIRLYFNIEIDDFKKRKSLNGVLSKYKKEDIGFVVDMKFEKEKERKGSSSP